MDRDEPAFPQTNFRGLTERDYFAAQVAAGIVATEGFELTPPKAVAERAYHIAEAMMQERKRYRS